MNVENMVAMRYPKLEVNFKVKHKMKIGELAQRSGVPASTIRYYEREGLLPKAQRGANGYRAYEDGALERLDLIQLGQSLGFPLETIRTMLTLQGDARKDALAENLETRLGEIDRLSAVLDKQRLSLLEARRQLQSAWAQGACVLGSDLARSRERGADEPAQA
jgi:DNA-binding transcriptional MerR regulator